MVREPRLLARAPAWLASSHAPSAAARPGRQARPAIAPTRPAVSATAWPASATIDRLGRPYGGLARPPPRAPARSGPEGGCSLPGLAATPSTAPLAVSTRSRNASSLSPPKRAGRRPLPAPWPRDPHGTQQRCRSAAGRGCRTGPPGHDRNGQSALHLAVRRYGRGFAGPAPAASQDRRRPTSWPQGCRGCSVQVPECGPCRLPPQRESEPYHDPAGRGWCGFSLILWNVPGPFWGVGKHAASDSDRGTPRHWAGAR